MRPTLLTLALLSVTQANAAQPISLNVSYTDGISAPTSFNVKATLRSGAELTSTRKAARYSLDNLYVTVKFSGGREIDLKLNRLAKNIITDQQDLIATLKILKQSPINTTPSTGKGQWTIALPQGTQ